MDTVSAGVGKSLPDLYSLNYPCMKKLAWIAVFHTKYLILWTHISSALIPLIKISLKAQQNRINGWLFSCSRGNLETRDYKLAVERMTLAQHTLIITRHNFYSAEFCPSFEIQYHVTCIEKNKPKTMEWTNHILSPVKMPLCKLRHSL